MLENPFVILCAVGLCWPGLIPMAIVFYLARRFDFQIKPRGEGENI